MGINLETAIHAMEQLRNQGVRYSMSGSRTGTDGTADCSGAIYACLRKAGASNAGWVLNTDSMHSWLGQNGFQLIFFMFSSPNICISRIELKGLGEINISATQLRQLAPILTEGDGENEH